MWSINHRQFSIAMGSKYPRFQHRPPAGVGYALHGEPCVGLDIGTSRARLRCTWDLSILVTFSKPQEAIYGGAFTQLLLHPYDLPMIHGHFQHL